MGRHKLRKLMAYIYMPLIFAILGYGMIYLAAKPLLEVGGSLVSLVMSSGTSGDQNMEGKTFEAPAIEDANAQAATLPIEDIVYPEFGDIYGRLACDRIGLAVDVYYGDDSQFLREGAGQFIGSGLPGGGRQILLAGHNVTTFAPLQDIAVGDVVTFTTTYGIYQYQITDAQVTSSNDPNSYDLLASGEKLVLYTCYPFSALGSTNQRYFVYGEKILGPEIVQGGAQ